MTAPPDRDIWRTGYKLPVPAKWRQLAGDDGMRHRFLPLRIDWWHWCGVCQQGDPCWRCWVNARRGRRTA